MEVSVWDTYFTKKDGKVMHFDIIVPAMIKDERMIHSFGNEYLQYINKGNPELTAKSCSFCHIEKATDEMERSIQQKGYYIMEMEGCQI